MGAKQRNLLASQNGLAMILAISLIALLSTLAVWLILESRTGMQMTKAYERMESTMLLSEAACWQEVHRLDEETPERPTSRELTVINPSYPYEQANQQVASGAQFTPRLRSSSEYYNTLTTGWGINGPAQYTTRFYQAQGIGTEEISASRGSARFVMYNFVSKKSRASR